MHRLPNCVTENDIKHILRVWKGSPTTKGVNKKHLVPSNIRIGIKNDVSLHKPLENFHDWLIGWLITCHLNWKAWKLKNDQQKTENDKGMSETQNS